MTRDEQFFSEPEVFRPERHRAQSDSKENTEIGYGQDDPSTIIFGFGRRCVLEHPNHAYNSANCLAIIPILFLQK